MEDMDRIDSADSVLELVGCKGVMLEVLLQSFSILVYSMSRNNLHCHSILC